MKKTKSASKKSTPVNITEKTPMPPIGTKEYCDLDVLEHSKN